MSSLDVITDPFAKPRKVYFKDEKIAFDGVPFSIIGSKVFECQHGPDRKKAFKARQANEKLCFAFCKSLMLVVTPIASRLLLLLLKINKSLYRAYTNCPKRLTSHKFDKI